MKDIKIASMIEKNMRKNNWTMKELGEKLGKSESTVSLWISGKAQPRMGTVQKMANLFDIPTDELVFGQGNTTIQKSAFNDFLNADDATIAFINLPQIAAYGGYDLTSMSEDDKKELAKQILDSVKFFATKYIK